MGTVVVQKYGGSSVADVDKLKRVAARIARTRAEGHDVVVVVSAMGKTTDQLLSLAREVSPQPHRRELDMLLSVGERISMALLSMAVADLGWPAISFTGSQSGIITDTSHFSARVLEVRPQRIVEALTQGKVVIVAGYQGVSTDKEVTTLGRGGSDTSAIALAAALGAEYCEICSDVDGVYTADPRVVPEAYRIDDMSVEEMLTLARAGAKVLSAEAVAYAQKMGITIRAAASFKDTGHTTVGPQPLRRGVVAVTADTSLAQLVWMGEPEALTRVLEWMGEVGIVPVTLTTAEGSLSARFRTVNLPDLGRVLSYGTTLFGEALSVRQDQVTTTVVGDGVGEDLTRVQVALSALTQVGIVPRSMELGPSSITFLLERGEEVAALRALHHTLLTPSDSAARSS